MSEFHEQISNVLAAQLDRPVALQQVLALVLPHFNSETGTIHLLDPAKQVLNLTAQVGLPPQIMDVVRVIPVGKGIAGETVVRNGPVTICNIQKDTSGVAKAGAKQTGVGGALCVPIRQAGVVTGTLGIGTRREHEYTAEETKALEAVAEVVGARLG